MCGINGIVDFSGRPVARQEIEAMNKALIHRGPDGEGIFTWSDEYKTIHCGLGHRRLSIIDIEGGSQPMANEDGAIVVTYNGEIYNFPDLRDSLLRRGHDFRSRCDTEVVIHQYEEDDTGFVDSFNGMYALGLWDSRRRRLILARDRVGIKPLFYTVQRNRIIFSSEIKPILKALGHVPELDEEALFRYLLLQYVPSPRTIFKGIYKLPPASIMIIDESGNRVIRYWDVAERGQPEIQGKLEENLFELLSDSVSKHLISDVPIGSFLSGGIDSSAIVYMISRILNRPVKTFSVGFDGPDEYNETNFALLAARHCNTEHHEIIMRAKDVPDLFHHTIEYLDEPVSDPAILPTFLVSNLARQYVKVVLTGEGADELFGGYLRYSLDRLASFYPGAFARCNTFLSRPFSDRRRAAMGLYALTGKGVHRRHISWASVFLPEEMEMIWKGNRGLSSLYKSVEEDMREILSGYKNDRRPFHQMQYCDLKTWLPDDLLTKVDRMSMAVSLEARVPYLDHRIVEMAFSIKGNRLLKGMKGKYLLRKAFEKRLPWEILYRRKRGFSPPLAEWFRRELRQFIRDISLSIDFIDTKGFNAILNRHLDGKEDMSLPLWSIITLNTWYEEIKRTEVRGH